METLPDSELSIALCEFILKSQELTRKRIECLQLGMVLTDSEEASADYMEQIQDIKAVTDGDVKEVNDTVTEMQKRGQMVFAGHLGRLGLYNGILYSPEYQSYVIRILDPVTRTNEVCFVSHDITFQPRPFALPTANGPAVPTPPNTMGYL